MSAAKENHLTIKKKLISKRKNIKQKLKELKHGQVEHENLFQPITKHLYSIENKLDKKNHKNVKESVPEEIKHEFSDDEDFDRDDADVYAEKASILSEPIMPTTSTPYDSKDTPKGVLKFSTPATAPHMKRKLNFSTIPKPDSDTLRKQILKGVYDELQEEDIQKQKEYENQLNKTIRENSLADYEEQYHSLPLRYVKKFIKDPQSKNSDGTFRVKFNQMIEEFSIGNKRIDFNGPDIIVAGKMYKGTKGLYGLLFNKNVPSVYTKQDVKNYVQILHRSNAIRKNFSPNSDLITSTNTKYKKFIQPLITKSNEESSAEHEEKQQVEVGESKEGAGMLMTLTNNPVDYVFWDDPNELVQRLRLLLASESAGNTGHSNEINSIIEELREADIIE